ncbi:MAG: site-specific integrase [Solirubrobacterales bacterium]|nr:site-specific integrase [Thermoleophilales bacterium]MCO5326113.1 site-specific integrase [Solirubrobacterales bacterium]
MSKRSHGEGSVRRRGQTWEIAFRPSPGARQVWERVGRECDGVDREFALARLRERLTACGRGEGGQFEGHLFSVTAEEWLRRLQAMGKHSARTIELHTSNLRCHLIPAFGTTYLRQINDEAIEDYWMAKVNFAPGEEGCPPVRGKVAAARTKPLMASLGLRIGEVFALRPSDYLPGSRTLCIRRTLTKVGGRTLISPYAKTDAGERDLRVSESMHRRLMRQRARAERQRVNASGPLLFPNRRGNPVSESNWRNRTWKDALDRAGLPKANPHRLRHTAASEMIARKPFEPTTVIAYRLGHRVETLLKTYAHLFERHRGGVADLGDLYSG